MAVTTTHNTYGAQTSISVQKVAASKFKKRSGFVYPLTGTFKSVTGAPPALQNNVSEGGYFSKSYGVNLIRNNLRQLLLCEKGERVMLPDYGLSLQRYIFEPLDETTYELIKLDVLRTLKKYFNIVQVVSLSVFSSPIQTNRSELSVKLTLQLLDESLDIFDVEVTIA
jgi:phage baseplate assembly protein W|tara:strand:+ start:234 stop:737 length:504 start_codon:yes stop_codon:yes gene_type:complete